MDALIGSTRCPRYLPTSLVFIFTAFLRVSGNRFNNVGQFGFCCGEGWQRATQTFSVFAPSLCISAVASGRGRKKRPGAQPLCRPGRFGSRLLAVVRGGRKARSWRGWAARSPSLAVSRELGAGCSCCRAALAAGALRHRGTGSVRAGAARGAAAPGRGRGLPCGALRSPARPGCGGSGRNLPLPGSGCKPRPKRGSEGQGYSLPIASSGHL